jgi:hypothetical protein
MDHDAESGSGNTGSGSTDHGSTDNGSIEVYARPAGQSALMTSQMSPPNPAGSPAAPGSGPGPRTRPWHRWEHGTAIVAGAVVLVVIAVVLVVVALAQGPGPGGPNRAVSITEGSVRTVDLQGVPGQVRIVAATGGPVRLTGSLHWSGRTPAATARVGRGHVLWLSYRCAAASPCTENYLLVVPRNTAIVLRQPSGHVIISGLAGSLRITAASVDISASRLRCPALTAVITSGHMSATFAAPPRKLSVTLTSAQATVRLPGSVSYAVSSQVTSGYVHVGVPQSAAAARTVMARIDSGELELLSS